MLDLGTERLSWRRLDVLLRHLPRDSALVTAIAGPPPPWSDLEHLVAMVVDQLQVSNWLFRKVHGRGAGPAPTPIPRPKPVDRRGPVDLAARVREIRARLARFRKPKEVPADGN